VHVKVGFGETYAPTGTAECSTLDEYGHLFPNADDAAVGRLDTMFWAAERRSSGVEVVALRP